MQALAVHSDRRYLMTTDGEPFFYLGDTAWELLHALSREETQEYLDVRQQQGFNVIQTVALAEFDGLRTPNYYGRVPLSCVNGVFRPESPDTSGEYSYWDHVDFVIQEAKQRGLRLALLPTWGDKFNQAHGLGPEIFTSTNAHAYGLWLGQRYRDAVNLVWMLGGDRELVTDEHRAIIDAMAAGLREGDGGSHLVTFHPRGNRSSVDDVPGRDYLDFHTTQSSHDFACFNSAQLLLRTATAEVKPCLDAEHRYEGIAACMKPNCGYRWNAADIRVNAYWNIMAGACGDTYGHDCVWSMNRTPEERFVTTWRDALRWPGAVQAVNLRRLRLSRPYFEFRPAPELAPPETAANAAMAAGRGDNYAFIYTPLGQPIRLPAKRLDAAFFRAAWHDPRSGEETAFGVFNQREALFVPPSSGSGCDWVLILDMLA